MAFASPGSFSTMLAFATIDDAAGNPLSSLKRQISITPVLQADGVTPYTNVRSVQVSIQYPVFNTTKTYTQQTYISAYR